MAIKPWVGAIK